MGVSYLSNRGFILNEGSDGSSAILDNKTIIENGIYNATDDSLDGYSCVTVDVPTYEIGILIGLAELITV